MADETRQSRGEAPNEASAKEKAEGSRENGNIPDSRTQQPTAGITNRSREDEQREQSELPPRGQRKDGDSHA